MSSLLIKGLSFSYGKDEILTDINLDLPEKSFLVMIGPNGGGKSTLLKVILGLLPIDKGSVEILGGSVRQPSGSIIGYVSQDSDRIKNFPINVLDTVKMGFYNNKMDKKEIKRLSFEAIELFGLDKYYNYRLSELSFGQRQRVFLARATVAKPKLLILDEPISAIDPKGQKDVLRAIHEKLPDSTVIFVSHDLSVIPGNATAVACVNRTLHYHPKGELTETLLTQAYGDFSAVKLISHYCSHCDELPKEVIRHA
jgi:zinc transport system ATP-binding protein